MGLFDLMVQRDDDIIPELPEEQTTIFQFDYRPTNGLLSPGRDYLNRLQEYAMQQDSLISSLYDQIHELESQLARSEGRVLQDMATTWATNWTQAQIRAGEAERNARLFSAELEVENRRLQLEIEYLQNENDRLNDLLAAAEQAKDRRTTYKDKPRGADGRFKPSSVPAGDRQREAYYMARQGYSTAQIAAKLGISSDTVKRYQRAYAAKCDEPTVIEQVE